MRKDISEKSRLEKDVRGDGEERNESVHWLKHGEGHWMRLIIPGAFRGGLDGKGSKKSEEVMSGHVLGPTDGLGRDVERSWVTGWYFEKPTCVKKGKRLSEMRMALASIGNISSWLVPLPPVSLGAER